MTAHTDTAARVRALPPPSLLAAREHARDLDTAREAFEACAGDFACERPIASLDAEGLAAREAWTDAAHVASCAASYATASGAVLARCTLDGTPSAGLAVLGALAALAAVLQGAEALAAASAHHAPRGELNTPRYCAEHQRRAWRRARAYERDTAAVFDAGPWDDAAHGDTGALARAVVQLATGLEVSALVREVAAATHPVNARGLRHAVERAADAIAADLRAAGWEVPAEPRITWPDRGTRA